MVLALGIISRYDFLCCIHCQKTVSTHVRTFEHSRARTVADY